MIENFMSWGEILDKIRKAIVNLDIESIQKLCIDAIKAGISAYDIIMKGFSKGLEIVGEKYEKEEYYLAELVVAGEIVKEGMKVIEPHLKSDETGKIGKVVIGTVRGDLHDIGKNIVATLLRATGFEVIDLGVDVPPERFVDAVKEHKPDVVAMSALLTTTMDEMGNVIKALKEAGLRDKVKVIVGGAPITEEFAKKIGADAAAKDAVEGVNICKSWAFRVD
ncbi:MAG: corrinoid protein [Candidatus Bathyarchaeia archaeon]